MWKSYGGKVRVNTNGLANREYGRMWCPSWKTWWM